MNADNPTDHAAAPARTAPPLSAYARLRVERLRRPASFAFALGLCALVFSTRPSGFEGAFHTFIKLTGYSLVFVACIGRIWCAIHITGRKNRELCQNGPYAFTRNPLYFFSFLGAVGVCLGAQACLEAVLMALAFLTYYKFMIRTEEQRLKTLFGASYEEYCQTVPRFWPRWRKQPQVQVLAVNVDALTKAVFEAGLFLLAILGIELLEKLKSSHAEWFNQIPW
jgi:protein-S-isoprenylcysteine O-methyltransferase Ste14